jgi:hypothetical protein
VRRGRLLGICFLREARETAVGADRRAGKRGLRETGSSSGIHSLMASQGGSIGSIAVSAGQAVSFGRAPHLGGLVMANLL